MERKKVLLSINLGNFGSTGKIMQGCSNQARIAGYETYIVYPEDVKKADVNKNNIIIDP